MSNISYEEYNKALKEFAENEILTRFEQSEKDASFKIVGIFRSGRGKDKKIVVLIDKVSDEKAIHEIAKKYFKNLNYQVKNVDDIATGSSLTNGAGIKLKESNDFGTLGGIFKRKNSNAFFGLSNNHVIAHCNLGAKGDIIRTKDGNQVGELIDFFNLSPKGPSMKVNTIDAAIFKITDTLNMDWQPSFPQGVANAQINRRVYKKGAKTGVTFGIITAIKGSADINLRNTNYHFKDLFAIERDPDPANPNPFPEFIDFGDSGSLVLTLNNLIIGIILAKMGKYAYACPIKYIKNFGLEFWNPEVT
ncbi:MAG: hypothetical protein P8M17_01965 [Saprospiraceae bacterium]|nr:hypothetical protein [bacterium]MDB4414773.1 hypothetical protein [bacterium]MDC3209859.1 hypothetical protein [Saprospiraceae bacterium]MDG1434396.1 hypothetical protein [Saprospiraceae bacterium]MDG2417730.1 hypothetical protein [Saprospiraceae bacterium]